MFKSLYTHTYHICALFNCKNYYKTFQLFECLLIIKILYGFHLTYFIRVNYIVSTYVTQTRKNFADHRYRNILSHNYIVLKYLKLLTPEKSQNFEWWTRFNFLCIMRHVCVLAPFWTTPTRTPFSARSAELPFDHTPEHRLTETPWRAHTDRRTNQTTSANSGVRPDAQCPDVSFKTTRKARRYE